MATRFDSRNVAGQRKKENRSEGGKPYKFSLAIGKGTQQQPFPLSNATEELDQLTGLARGFAHLSLSCLLRFPHGIPAHAAVAETRAFRPS
jgi:hypothetical protein